MGRQCCCCTCCAVLLTYVRLLKSFPYLQKSKMSRVPPKPPFSSDSWI